MRRVPLALALLAAAACSDRVGRGWDWARMRAQPRYEAYGPSAFFADGKAMRAPPAGTVSRESGDSATAVPNDFTRAAVVARGADRYAVFCGVCHGERGDGESLVASNMDAPRPPSLVDSARRALGPARLYTIISHGYGRMPAFASALSAADRWAVAAYVVALQRGAP
jgi:mono/diheme cytochrome c family protein